MDSTGADQASTEAVLQPPEPGLVVVKAEDYAFTAPPSFPSGWVKIRFENLGAETHFMIIWDLPDGITFDDYTAQVAQPFEDLYAKYRSGELDQEAFFEQLLAAIPDWFYNAVPKGGPGFTAPGQVSETMVYLEPGDNYALECYVRAMTQPDSFHGGHGMLRPLIVTEESTGIEPPEADIEIALSSFEMVVEGDLSAGSHAVRVTVADTPEGFIRHNVHLVRLEGEQTVEQVAPWMNWVDEMLPPAPAVFLGGAGQTVAGRESYFRVNLESGRYAWISEAFGVQGMVHDFTVQ
jgi:hypothetical protein